MLISFKTSSNMLVASVGNELHRVKPRDILYIESVDKKAFLCCENEVYESKQKLYELEELALKDFLRISKSVIVNVNKIKTLIPSLSGNAEAILTNNERVVISRRYVNELKKSLGMERGGNAVELGEFAKQYLYGFMFVFTFTVVAMVVYLNALGYDFVPMRDIAAVFAMSILIPLSGLVLCSNRALKRHELLIRNIFRILITIGIVLSVASFMGWISWSAPISIVPYMVITAVIYSAAVAIEFYESKKLTSKMNEKLRERKFTA